MMKNCEYLLNLLPILFPVFYSSTDDDGNEFVFLDYGDRISNLTNRIGDKTSMEAFQNHFHLFGKQNESNKAAILEISTAISKHLLDSLKHKYPKKSFVVFLEVNMKDSTVIRFHQQWKDEVPYFDVNELKSMGIEVYEFKS